MSIGAVTNFEQVALGAWFIFSRQGEPGIAIKVALSVASEKRLQCVVVTRGAPPLMQASNWNDGSVFVIAETLMLPLPGLEGFRSDFIKPILPGCLIFEDERPIMSFLLDHARVAFIDLRSGEVQPHSPKPPFGQFTTWRLLRRGPNDFEEMFQFSASDAEGRVGFLPAR